MSKSCITVCCIRCNFFKVNVSETKNLIVGQNLKKDKVTQIVRKKQDECCTN